MTLQAEVLVDRRRLKRQLGIWRAVALVLVAALVAFLVLRQEAVGEALTYRPHIARVTISGIIQDSREQQELLERLARSDRVAAVILAINSPGGTTTGGEALNEALRRLAADKPVVSVMGTIATSAAYMAAVATDRIFARANTITGSVGVVFQWAEISSLLESLGVRVEEIKSGPLKANPSPFQPIDEAGRRLAEDMVAEAERWFLDLVVQARNIDPDAVPGLTEGRVYSGRMALDYRLIDGIGGEKAAQTWLEEQRGIAKGLRIVDWQPEGSGSFGLLGAGLDRLAGWLGGPAKPLVRLLDNAGAAGVRLDGLVSLWHPRIN